MCDHAWQKTPCVFFGKIFWGANLQVAAMWPEFEPFELFSLELSQEFAHKNTPRKIAELKKKN